MAEEIISCLLDEFKYRHELFWKIVFRFSSAILVLYAIPFLNIETGRSIDQLALVFPIVGCCLSIGGVALLMLEYKILSFVEGKYNECKESIKAGCSNIHALNHKHIGHLIIIVWGGFFSLLGILEGMYLGGWIALAK